MDDLTWLCNWIKNNKTNVLNNALGIGTLDNPGWYLSVYLTESFIEKKALSFIELDVSDHDWVRCFIKDQRFECPGGPENLSQILYCFRYWIENSDSNFNFFDKQNISANRYITALSAWFLSECNEDWEHCYGISIKTVRADYWEISIDFEDTELEGEHLNSVEKKGNQDDWIYCYTEDNTFKGECGLLNLQEALAIFINWMRKRN